MIQRFLKEYGAWYLFYVLGIVLYFLVFYLYHLPLEYFLTVLWLQLFLGVLLTIFLFLRYRNKLHHLEDFRYLEDLDELHSPSDRAYYKLIKTLQDDYQVKLLEEKEKRAYLQNMIKIWAHQMKIPIFAISLMSQTNHLTKKEVDQQLLHLENDVNNLLTYLKFSENQDDYRFEELSVRQMIQEVIKKYRILFLSKEISITIDGDWLLKTDKKWFSFVLGQIIDNAIKYSETKGGIDIFISDKSIIIRDYGIGILQEDIPRIFEQGFTGFNGHEHQKATGLGLYISKQILDRLDLDISITSQINQGTCVEIKRH